MGMKEFYEAFIDKDNDKIVFLVSDKALLPRMMYTKFSEVSKFMEEEPIKRQYVVRKYPMIMTDNVFVGVDMSKCLGTLFFGSDGTITSMLDENFNPIW